MFCMVSNRIICPNQTYYFRQNSARFKSHLHLQRKVMFLLSMVTSNVECYRLRRCNAAVCAAYAVLIGAFSSFATQTTSTLAAEGSVTLLSASVQHDSRRQLSARPMTTKKHTAEGPQPTMPLPRDPQLAVEEEFKTAKRQGTREAYDLFIARHPDNPLATEARRLRERISKGR